VGRQEGIGDEVDRRTWELKTVESAQPGRKKRIEQQRHKTTSTANSLDGGKTMLNSQNKVSMVGEQGNMEGGGKRAYHLRPKGKFQSDIMLNRHKRWPTDGKAAEGTI